MEKKYRWDNPHEWLSWAITNREIDFSDFLSFALNVLDEDQIQDRYENVMDECGYFDEDTDELGR